MSKTREPRLPPKREPDTCPSDGAKLIEEHVLLRAMINLMPDHVFVKDIESRFIITNKAVASCLGVEAPELLIGKSDFDLLPREIALNFMGDEQRIVSSGEPLIDHEELHINAQGVKRWYSATKIPLCDENGKIVGIVGMSRDITGRKKAEVSRTEQARVLEMIARSTPLESVLGSVIDLVESQLETVNGSILLHESDGQHLRLGSAPNLPQDFKKAHDGLSIEAPSNFDPAAKNNQKNHYTANIHQDLIYENLRACAASHGFQAHWAIPINSHHGQALGVLALYLTEAREPTVAECEFIDVGCHLAAIAIERDQAEEKIKLLAHYDALTGLLNRTSLDDRLKQAMLYADRHGSLVALVFLDLDGFKVINDGLGHHFGDELLKIVADRLLRCVRATDTVVRLGGDEFVIVLTEQPETLRTIAEILQRVLLVVAQPVLISDQTLQVTCSIGLAIYPHDANDVGSLLKNADTAMYRVKKSGRNSFQFFCRELNMRLAEEVPEEQSLLIQNLN